MQFFSPQIEAFSILRIGGLSLIKSIVDRGHYGSKPVCHILLAVDRLGLCLPRRKLFLDHHNIVPARDRGLPIVPSEIHVEVLLPVLQVYSTESRGIMEDRNSEGWKPTPD